jgi:hypothetical protein
MNLSELFSIIIVPIITSVIGVIGTIIVEILRNKKTSTSQSGNLMVPKGYKSVYILNWRTITLIGGLVFIVTLLFVLIGQNGQPRR